MNMLNIVYEINYEFAGHTKAKESMGYRILKKNKLFF